MAEAERQHYNVTLAILTVAGTAYALQQTMVIPALPTLQHDLHTTTTWVTWVLTVLLLVASVSTPVFGKLGDQYGKEQLLVISLVLFFVGCAGAAAAWNIWSLIFFRAFQGLGAAVFPLSFGIIRDEFPREKVGVGIGLISAVFGVGGGFGIVFSGLIVDNLSWRWLFIFGAIPVAIAAVLVHRFVPESPIKTPSRVDFLGALLLSVGLICLLVALTEGESWGWTSARVGGLFAGAALFLALWVGAELRVPEPMVDMHVFVQRQVLFTNICALITGFAMFGTFVLIPNFVETPRGLAAGTARLVHYGFDASATKAGLYLLPSSLALLFAGPAAGLIGRRTGSKWPLAAGMLLSGISAGMLALWHDEPWQVLVAMPVLGTGVGFAFAAMATLITEAVRPSETGIATGMNTVMRTVGGVIGGEVGAAILSARLIGGTNVPAARGYEVAFAIAAIAAFVGVVVAVLVTPRRERLVVAAEASD
ncbi:MAG: MFS transporter [Actinobacteria bacterium]|nr:MAG: MFS transporter [Actinomycetota bacterium]